MVRVVGGYEEEVTRVVKGKLVEYRINAGMPGTFHKGRLIFKPDATNGDKTHVVWTIFWSPTGFAAGMVYKLVMTGFCNIALYNLDRKVQGLALADAPAGDDDAAAAVPTDGPVDPAAGMLKDGEVPSLQYAARLQTGYEGNLTAKQQKGLADLLEALKADPEALELLHKHPDGAQRMALRFLRAECHGRDRDFNVVKSQKRLAETLRFRRDMGADAMLVKAPPCYTSFVDIGGELEVIDREGRVVVFSRAGLLSVYMDPKALMDEEWKQCVVCLTERRLQMLRESSKRLGHEVSATVVVYDLKGMSFASRNIIPFTKVINSIAAVHYPEMVDVIVLCNAPGIFSSIWSMVKGFLDPVTRSKVQVYSAGKQDKERLFSTFRAMIDPAKLPKEYGGDSSIVVPLPGPAIAAGVKL